MNISEIINTTTGIATLITAIVAFITVNEMRKQRKESYKPIVIPIENYYSLKSYEDGRFSGSTQVSNGYEPNIFLYLANAGLGPAVNIVIQWEFDFKSFISKNDFNGIIISYENEKFYVRENEHYSTSYVKNQKDELVEYLLSGESGKTKLLLPEYTKVILKLLTDRKQKGITTYMPKLKLIITYKDIGLSEYKHEYGIEFIEYYVSKLKIEPLIKYDANGKIDVKTI